MQVDSNMTADDVQQSTQVEQSSRGPHLTLPAPSADPSKEMATPPQAAKASNAEVPCQDSGHQDRAALEQQGDEERQNGSMPQEADCAAPALQSEDAEALPEATAEAAAMMEFGAERQPGASCMQPDAEEAGAAGNETIADPAGRELHAGSAAPEAETNNEISREAGGDLQHEHGGSSQALSSDNDNESV